MKSKRILFIAPHFAEYSERLAAGLAGQLPTRLILNSYNRSDEMQHSLSGKASVTAIPMERRWHHAFALFYCIFQAMLFRADLVIVQEGVRQFLKPMIGLLRRFTRVALIVHDPKPHSGSDSSRALVDVPYRRWLREHADVLIVHGERCLSEMVSLGYDPERILSIRHGVLMTPKRRQPKAAKPGRILMFGRMEAYKGLEVLLDAASLLSARGVDFHLVVAGAGPEQGRLAHRIATMPNVEVIPRYLTPEELQRELALTSFVVAPYLDATQSGVLASTFANGRAAIASNVGGLSDVVKHEINGLLVPPGDATALADAMAAFLQDPNQIHRLGRGAENFADDELNWDRIAENLLSKL
ncbi:glycosyltransferase family 4 protein [Sphingobium sp. D43FB]|uniref:glycosyltransferase family 4 protein n=1 Tax=Sphingobium sp. D43FB TaxID=2017595 RepID=UPI000BB587A4|nr:glycosyltransferase family 4 protein [Sphingobium sp. D43FB]PBN41616.1 glycosyltransferase [Sphingobium sp. D43FB]